MKTLQQYDLEALKILQTARRLKGKFRITSELLTDMVTAMAEADHTFCEGKLSQYKWRRYKAICAIKTYLREQKKPKGIKFIDGVIGFKDFRRVDYDKNTGCQVDFFLGNAGLTRRQKQFVETYLQYGDIGIACEQSGITYKEGASLWDVAIKKFKRIAVHA